MRLVLPALGCVLFLLLLARPANAIVYTATILHPLGINDSEGDGVSVSSQVGWGVGPATGNQTHAFLWNGTSASAVDLHPPGLPTTSTSVATGVSGSTQAGYVYNNGFNHATLWNGSAATAVDLNPPGFINSSIAGISGNLQVGTGGTVDGESHALLWAGTATSSIDLHPSGFVATFGFGISGNTQVGSGFGTVTGNAQHALMWTGSAASYVDLNPAGYSSSAAWGASGNTQVGDGSIGGQNHALLWSGTAASFVDLNPAGFTFSAGHGVFGNVQVGNGDGPATGNRSHALLWSGTAGSWQDLHQYLASSGINFNSSVALGIDSNGNIIGSARVLNDEHSYAILWSPGAVPEPSTSLSLGLLAVVLSMIQGPYRTLARRMTVRRSRRS